LSLTEAWFNKVFSFKYFLTVPSAIFSMMFSGFPSAIAFSLPISGPILNIVIVSIVLGLIFYLIYLIKHRYAFIIIATLLALTLGALSNALDRLTYGYVIDYLDVLNFTVLNIADILISIRAFILILLNLSSSKDNKKTISKDGTV
jgi:signal peptidase II